MIESLSDIVNFKKKAYLDMILELSLTITRRLRRNSWKASCCSFLHNLTWAAAFSQHYKFIDKKKLCSKIFTSLFLYFFFLHLVFVIRAPCYARARYRCDVKVWRCRVVRKVALLALDWVGCAHAPLPTVSSLLTSWFEWCRGLQPFFRQIRFHKV